MIWHPAGVREDCGVLGSGGVAALNRRLQADIPPGCAERVPVSDSGGGPGCSPQPTGPSGPQAQCGGDAGGIRACSRWLSAAIPPGDETRKVTTPAGVAALPQFIARDAESHAVSLPNGAEVLENLKGLMK